MWKLRENTADWCANRLSCTWCNVGMLHAKTDQHCRAVGTVLLTMWNYWPQEFIDINMQWYHCHNKCYVAAAGGDEWAVGSWHSSVKCLNHWWKPVECLVCYSWTFNTQLHVHLKNWPLKFKLLYLLNHITCFNKICRRCVYSYTYLESLAEIRATFAEIQNFVLEIVFYWHTLYI